MSEAKSDGGRDGSEERNNNTLQLEGRSRTYVLKTQTQSAVPVHRLCPFYPRTS